MYARLKKLMRNIYYDFRFSGRFLGGNKLTPHSDRGAFNTVNSDYDILPFLFSKVEILPDDTLIDVGCGKGRVIVYWLSRGLSNQLVGIELDKSIADDTREQFRKFKNVEIMHGDVNEVFDGSRVGNGQIYYMYNPFNQGVMELLEKKLSELSRDRSITVIYHRSEFIDVFQKAGSWIIEKIVFDHSSGYKSDSAIIKNLRKNQQASNLRQA
jgi:SAM-dependent methyltransferase